jgi:hypothetical protein
MVPQSGRVGLDDDDVEAGLQRGQRPAIRQHAGGDDPRGCFADTAPLSEVDGLLGEAEGTTRPEADLNDHEPRRRARVDRHEIELMTTDMDVPGEDRPALLRQSFRDEGLRVVAEPLRRRPSPGLGPGIHPPILANDAYPTLIPRCARSRDARCAAPGRAPRRAKPSPEASAWFVTHESSMDLLVSAYRPTSDAQLTTTVRRGRRRPAHELRSTTIHALETTPTAR